MTSRVSSEIRGRLSGKKPSSARTSATGHTIPRKAPTPGPPDGREGRRRPPRAGRRPAPTQPPPGPPRRRLGGARVPVRPGGFAGRLWRVAAVHLFEVVEVVVG